ncbi:nuclear transport factor 2 family protein [Nocardioides zeae]|uniref:Nuclear transport factor 2 family protein n=1 Tax=Nocardioides imazamoxiresistens TaxID=3231893 RepID=A0ABU3PQZ8_9ACTN|nr:nuclear transport factor 2 family protein [Nocardioides zeae]MDT9591655.1 nuclear transport factor 2 family protein [Nocardioides zeae]
MSARDGEELVVAYLDAVSALDAAAVAPLFAADGRVDLPYAPEGVPRSIEGREAIDAYYRALPEMVSEMNFTDYRVHALDEPGEYVAEYRSSSSMRATGAPYANTYITRVSVRDGEITRLAEFFDPVELIRAMGGTVRPAGA